MLALYTGQVQPAGVDLNLIPIHNPREVFDRAGVLRCESARKNWKR
jgi:hypothetical protein